MWTKKKVSYSFVAQPMNTCELVFGNLAIEDMHGNREQEWELAR